MKINNMTVKDDFCPICEWCDQSIHESLVYFPEMDSDAVQTGYGARARRYVPKNCLKKIAPEEVLLMDKDKLLNDLKRQEPAELIELLENCLHCMKTRDIRHVFGSIENKFLRETSRDGNRVLKKAQKFFNDSLKRVYYAPFNMNSKNFSDIPEETDRWFEELAELLTESSQLSAQGDHRHAVKCFGLLFELMNKLGSDEIVFAEEVGMWMLPIEGEPCIQAYIQSAAAILEPEDYVETVLPLIHADSHSSFINRAYEKAKNFANEKQQRLLEEVVMKKQKKSERAKINNVDGGCSPVLDYFM